MAASSRKVAWPVLRSTSRFHVLRLSSLRNTSQTRCLSQQPQELETPKGLSSLRNTSQTRCLSQQPQELETPKVEEPVDPLKCHDYFGVRDLVSVDSLFQNLIHYGHHEGCRNDYMKPYLFGTRMGIDIFDLEKTLPLFQDALNFTAHIAYRKGIILFISRNKYTTPLVEKTAQYCEEYAHCRYWSPGLFTDSKNRFGMVTRLPDLCIFIHTQNSVFAPHVATVDAAKMLIPTVGVVDSNCDPRLISYPVPGNDDSFLSVTYYLEVFEEAIKRGKAKRKEHGLD